MVTQSAEQMFNLVNDVESYPEFMPWCSGARVLESNDEQVLASLELNKGGLTRWFTTRNTLDFPHRLDMDLVKGPFRHLDGGWRFRDIDDAGSEVLLDIEFEFDSFLIDLTFGHFFEQTCNTLVDAFVKRAAVVYA